MNDLSGMRFGRLVVVCMAGRSKNGGNLIWSCMCDCGQQKDALSTSLRNGDTSSCGCYQRESAAEKATKHGHTSRTGVSKTYATWAAMVQRCTNDKANGYENYGGRGIGIEPAWLDFENFLSDMGVRPKDRTLDRIDNDAGYCKPNCRWATKKEQANNRRKRRFWKRPVT